MSRRERKFPSNLPKDCQQLRRPRVEAAIFNHRFILGVGGYRIDARCSYRGIKMRTLTTIVVALVIAVAAASQAMAGMCDDPPYGANQKSYKLFVDLFGEVGTLDFLPNVCRAKYKGDEKIRKALVDIGVS